MRGSRKASASRADSKLKTVERKILVILCYYVLLGAIALTSYTLSTRNVEEFIKGVSHYFLCESPGMDPDSPCDRSGFENFSYPILTLFGYILLGLFPAVNLIFAVDIRELKQWCGQHAPCFGISVSPPTPRKFPNNYTTSTPLSTPQSTPMATPLSARREVVRHMTDLQNTTSYV